MSPAPVSPAIDVEGLNVVRGGRTVVHDVTFTLAPGDLVGLLGPSGCGKSSLLRSLVGTQAAVTGRVELLGEPAGSKALRGRVAYVTQAPSVYGDLSVLENLRYFASLLGVDEAGVTQVVADVHLASHARTLVSRLSGGEQARVSLATALLGSPRVLVLDEPTVGLDPLLRRDLWALFARLAAAGTTLLVSSHVMDEAQRCGRILVMREGAILADTTPAGFLAATGAADFDTAFVQLLEGKGA